MLETENNNRHNESVVHLNGTKVTDCRYGENAWQASAALYSTESDDPLGLNIFKVLEGEPGYNNWCDVDRGLQTMTHIAAVFEKNFGYVPFIAIGLKHGNVCGVSINRQNLSSSFAPSLKDTVIKNMLSGDPISIFGGTVMCNFEITENLATLLRTHGMEKGKRLLDIVVAPSFEQNALEILGRKDAKCKILVNSNLAHLSGKSLDTGLRVRYVRGGFLTQPNYTFVPDFKDAQKNKDGEVEREKDLALAWAICSTSNSNTITIVKHGKLLANAVGQQDRVGAVELALSKASRANHDVYDSAACSDSFFPFPDAPELLVDHGIKMLLTTTGSVNDDKMIEVCKNITVYSYPDSIARGFYAH